MMMDLGERLTCLLAAQEQDPANWNGYLVLADALDEAGRAALAYACRWMAAHRHHPFRLKAGWRWYHGAGGQRRGPRSSPWNLWQPWLRWIGRQPAPFFYQIDRLATFIHITRKEVSL